MKLNKKISLSYKMFCGANGNQHIASEFAVLKLQDLLENFKIRSILEVGLGIGSIAGCLLEVNKNLIYVGTEDNEFCLEALEQNLLHNYKRIKLHPGLAHLDKKSRFDLIIIDGQDNALQSISLLLSPAGIIAIEGDRQKQQNELLQIFPNHLYVHCISKEKNKNYSPFPVNQWQGGIKIIFVNPTFSQKLWWLHEKISSKWKYLMIR